MLEFLRNAKPVTATADSPVALLTYYKAGSQWVRDLLTHRFSAEANGYRNAETSVSMVLDSWPEVHPREITGPIYDASLTDWENHRRPNDKAVVLLRDPRDIVVSKVYSWVFSHVPCGYTESMRSSLLAAPKAAQLLFSICDSISTFQSMETWSTLDFGVNDSVFLTSYERMVADTRSELSAICKFLDWDVRKTRIDKIVDELSFEFRSGRQRGDEQKFSHYRKGVPGDWVNHFDKMTGHAFNRISPGLVVNLGYETDGNWIDNLPDVIDETPVDLGEMKQVVELQAEVVRLKEQVNLLRAA
jgi:hypothetical protein